MRPRGIEPRLQDPQSCVLSIERRARKMPKGILRGFARADKRGFYAKPIPSVMSKSNPTRDGVG